MRAGFIRAISTQPASSLTGPIRRLLKREEHEACLRRAPPVLRFTNDQLLPLPGGAFVKGTGRASSGACRAPWTSSRAYRAPGRARARLARTWKRSDAPCALRTSSPACRALKELARADAPERTRLVAELEVRGALFRGLSAGGLEVLFDRRCEFSEPAGEPSRSPRALRRAFPFAVLGALGVRGLQAKRARSHFCANEQTARSDMLAMKLPRTRDVTVSQSFDSQSLGTAALTDRNRRGGAPSKSRPDRRGTSEHVILFGAANPSGTDPLALAEECAEVERELQLTNHRERFRLESRWALTVDEFMRYLTQLNPSVCHFSGHGCRGAGVMFQDEQRRPHLVSGRALAMMIAAASPGVRVVVLNGCYTAELAEPLCSIVDCVVGMDGAVADDAARSFAIRYYSAIGNGRSIANAVAQGVAVLAAKQLPCEVLPRCLTRDGINADDVVLVNVDSGIRGAGAG